MFLYVGVKAKRLKKEYYEDKMLTYSVSEELNRTFGAPGTESRRKAEEQAWEEYNAQILLDGRKESGIKKTYPERAVLKGSGVSMLMQN